MMRMTEDEVLRKVLTMQLNERETGQISMDWLLMQAVISNYFEKGNGEPSY